MQNYRSNLVTKAADEAHVRNVIRKGDFLYYVAEVEADHHAHDAHERENNDNKYAAKIEIPHAAFKSSSDAPACVSAVFPNPGCLLNRFGQAKFPDKQLLTLCRLRPRK